MIRQPYSSDRILFLWNYGKYTHIKEQSLDRDYDYVLFKLAENAPL